MIIYQKHYKKCTSVFLILLMDHIIRIPRCSRNFYPTFLSLVHMHKVMAMSSSELGFDTFITTSDRFLNSLLLQSNIKQVT